MSHFWEVPSFADPALTAAQQQLRFQQQVINILGPGDGTADFAGLLQYIGGEGPFSPDMHVQAIIITPRNRINPVNGVMMYADMARQIATAVTQLFGGNFDAGLKGNLADPVIFVDYTPLSGDFSQEWTSSGKAIFQYDPVQGRCISQWTGEPAQFAQQRLWFEDRPTQVTDYYWPVWPEQEVPETTQQQGSKRRDLLPIGTQDEQDHIYLKRLKKRQETWVAGVQPSLYPSCLAAIENTGTGPAEATAVLVGPNGPVSGYGSGSGLTTSTAATTTGAGSDHSTFATATSTISQMINSASSAASASAASYAVITSNPLCTPL